MCRWILARTVVEWAERYADAPAAYGPLCDALRELRKASQGRRKRSTFQVEVPPFSGEKEVAFAPPIGRVRTYLVPHSETHTLPRFLPGLRRVDVRGTWRPEIMTALRLYHEGILSLPQVHKLRALRPTSPHSWLTWNTPAAGAATLPSGSSSSGTTWPPLRH